MAMNNKIDAYNIYGKNADALNLNQALQVF